MKRRNNSPFNSQDPELDGQQWFLNKQITQDQNWLEKVTLSGFSRHESREVSINRKPLWWAGGLMVAVFALLVWQLFSLQIVEGGKYRSLANGNRIREQIIYAPRGQILDRHGKVLADNTASFQLVAHPHLLPEANPKRQAVYNSIEQITGYSASKISKKAEKKGLDHTRPIVVADNILYQKALSIEAALPEVRGFNLNEVPIREYKNKGSLAHILGYVGRASEEELTRREDLALTDFIGKAGVEQSYDQLLRGKNGAIRTEVDARGRPLRKIAEENAQAGQDLRLTLDWGLQKHFARAIKKQMKEAKVKQAAGVAINPKNGEILASVSLPGYNNNIFSQGVSQDKYQRLVNHPLDPLQNKVISADYPSGSIIKPMHLSAALQEGVVDEDTTIVDRGRLVLHSQYNPGETFVFHGWDHSGLGPMNARRAIAMSSDIYFYTVGGGYQDFEGLGAKRLTKYYKLFGLGSKTGVNLPGESAGLVPTPSWKQKNYDTQWFRGDTYNISIGQGDLLVSPLQMARATAAVANNGKLLELQISKNKKPQVARQIPVKNHYLQIAREGMRQVITDGTTCQCTFDDVGVKVAGKSGTAETNPEANRRPHAWYTAYAPYENPEIVFAVLLEEGEGGSQYAAPAIAETMSWYFENRTRQ